MNARAFLGQLSRSTRLDSKRECWPEILRVGLSSLVDLSELVENSIFSWVFYLPCVSKFRTRTKAEDEKQAG